MRIGISCFDLSGEYAGGISSYTFGLLDAFYEEKKTTHSFNLFCWESNKHLFSKYLNDKRFGIFTFRDSLNKKRVLAKILRSGSLRLYELTRNGLYRKEGEAMDENSDIIYTPSTTLFYYKQKKPTVLSMHDIQQTHFPEFFTSAELRARKITYNLSARYATYLQASSEYIKNDLLSYFKTLKKENIAVIHEGVNINLFGTKKDTSFVLKKYDLPDKFLFFPAQLWHHKNHLHLLKTIKQLQKEKIIIPVVLTGAQFSSGEKVMSYIKENLPDQVFYLGKVPIDDLIALYQKARVLVMPSLHESSSLPVLEAAAAGTAIIASDISPNVEMSEKLSITLFKLNEDGSLKSKIESVWNDDELIKKQIDHNLKNISLYSWSNTARNYIDLFEKICQKNKDHK